MEISDYGKYLGVVVGVGAAAGGAIKAYIDIRNERRARDSLLQAEKEAYRTIPERLVTKTSELAASQEELETRTRQIAGLLEQAQASLRVGVLFDLYSKQIEKYQTETRARAGWSFIFAIVAMFAGLGFMIWGGSIVFTSGDWHKTAAGSAVSAIGGAVSAFITKTFLDVHRLSLMQLNRYFRQPVLNAHILTAQRLSDALTDSIAKQNAYNSIIARVVSLIREDPAGAERVRDTPAMLPGRTNRTRRETHGSSGNNDERQPQETPTRSTGET